MSASSPILYATDFSPASRPAFSEAVSAARSRRAPLWMINVLPPVVPPEATAYIPMKMYEDMESVLRRNAEKEMKALVTLARRKGVRARSLLAHGVPHEEIARAAKSKRAGLLVLGTHGRTGLSRLLLGSVAARVIVGAPCPVLTVQAVAGPRKLRRPGPAGAGKERQ